MKRLASGFSSLLALSLLGVANHSYGADDAVLKLAKDHVIACYHPTVKTAEATVEVLKDTVRNGDVATTRVKAYYQGLLKKNTMEFDVIVRQASSIREFRTKLLADTGSGGTSCPMEKYWMDF